MNNKRHYDLHYLLDLLNIVELIAGKAAICCEVFDCQMVNFSAFPRQQANQIQVNTLKFIRSYLL